MIFLQLPKITPQLLESFNKSLMEDFKDEKQQRVAFKKLLKDQQLTEKKIAVDPEISQSRSRSNLSTPSWEDNVSNLGLKQLFQ